MRRVEVQRKRPGCYGNMYTLGEDHMAENCLGCPSFNKCKQIGGGVETAPVNVLIPMEPAKDHEYRVRW